MISSNIVTLFPFITWFSMKKTFQLTHPKIKTARLFEALKHDIKKYLKRERNKALPKEMDYWAFDCKFGNSQDSAAVVFVEDITRNINEAETGNAPQVYVEIIARAALKSDIKKV